MTEDAATAERRRRKNLRRRALRERRKKIPANQETIRLAPTPPVDKRFKPGQSGNPAGRPPGLDFRRLVEKRAAAEGVPVEAAMWAIFVSMLKRARAGDVAAAKLLLDRLCTAVETGPQIAIITDRVIVGPPIPDDRQLGEYLRELVALSGRLLASKAQPTNGAPTSDDRPADS